MALVDDLKTKASDPYVLGDIDWYQFVLDHKDYIRQRSTQVMPSGEIIGQTRYDVTRWLRKENFEPKFWWIVMVINDINSDLDYRKNNILIPIFIPTVTVIKNLYTSYISTSTGRVTDALGM